MLTLNTLITDAADGRGFAGPGGWLTVIDGDDARQTSWGEVHHDALAMAAALQAEGVRHGDHVAILGPTTRELVCAIQATWLAGACVVMLPLPMRMASLEGFVAQTRARIDAADCSRVLLDRQLAEFIDAGPDDPPVHLLGDLVGTAEAFQPVAVRGDDLAVLQFTSGSTSEPKGVLLTHEAICHNIAAARRKADLWAPDVLVSWLPLYHDMGLIGLLTIPMTTGLRLVLGAPQDFMARPIRWMEWISDYGGTCTAGPNFAYVLATRALRRAEGLDLSQMRTALSGAEPVDAAAFRAFAAEAARFGFSDTALYPAFGMAEVCIAGCFPEPGSGLRTDVVDARVLEHEHYAASVEASHPNAKELVVLGRAVEGLTIRVVDRTTGEPCRDREVGELQIRGNALTLGYHRRPDATRELIVDGWLHTGDLAYLVDGELIMCGRIKDVIIIGGRNLYPQDIERVVGQVDGVRAGNVVAFGQTGRNSKEHIVVVAESKLDDPSHLRAEITHAVTSAVGVPPREVVLVAPGSIPKTSSGKLQRSACRDLLDAGELVVLGDDADGERAPQRA